MVQDAKMGAITSVCQETSKGREKRQTVALSRWVIKETSRKPHTTPWLIFCWPPGYNRCWEIVSFNWIDQGPITKEEGRMDTGELISRQIWASLGPYPEALPFSSYTLLRRTHPCPWLSAPCSTIDYKAMFFVTPCSLDQSFFGRLLAFESWMSTILWARTWTWLCPSPRTDSGFRKYHLNANNVRTGGIEEAWKGKGQGNRFCVMQLLCQGDREHWGGVRGLNCPASTSFTESGERHFAAFPGLAACAFVPQWHVCTLIPAKSWLAWSSVQAIWVWKIFSPRSFYFTEHYRIIKFG